MWRHIAQKGAEALARSCSSSGSVGSAAAAAAAVAGRAAVRQHQAVSSSSSSTTATATLLQNASSRFYNWSPNMSSLAARQQLPRLQQQLQRSILVGGSGVHGASGSSSSSSPSSIAAAAAASAAFGLRRGMTTVTDRKAAANPGEDFALMCSAV
jgi:hypothetical protein